jgi:FixJ family two-component response regulator
MLQTVHSTLCRSFTQLRQRRRDMAVAMASNGASHQQIAATLGISRVAATRRLGRAGVPHRRSAFASRVYCASQLGTRTCPLDLDTL